MRVAVVYFSGRRREKLATLAKALAKGIERQGNQVDVIDGARGANVKLTIYSYIAVGAEGEGAFGGKIPEQARTFLAASGIVSGKKSYAFVLKSPFGAAKAVAALMRCMEAEGMFLKSSDILRSPAEAEEIGKRLRVS
jgi:menaquinone-dependent protoporphyrinogen IX oxidase